MLLFVLLPSITRNTFRWTLCQKLLHTRFRLRDCTHQKCMHESYSNSNDSNSFKSVHIFSHQRPNHSHTDCKRIKSANIEQYAQSKNNAVFASNALALTRPPNIRITNIHWNWLQPHSIMNYNSQLMNEPRPIDLHHSFRAPAQPSFVYSNKFCTLHPKIDDTNTSIWCAKISVHLIVSSLFF